MQSAVKHQTNKSEIKIPLEKNLGIQSSEKIADVNVILSPELKIRVAATNNEEEMRHALRLGITWVTVDYK